MKRRRNTELLIMLYNLNGSKQFQNVSIVTVITDELFHLKLDTIKRGNDFSNFLLCFWYPSQQTLLFPSATMMASVRNPFQIPATAQVYV